MEVMTHEGGAVIYNPTAGRGQGGVLFKEAQDRLGLGFEWLPTRKAGQYGIKVV